MELADLFGTILYEAKDGACAPLGENEVMKK